MRGKKWTVLVLLSAMFLWSMAGCRTSESRSDIPETVPAEESPETDGGGEEKPFAGVTLTLLNFSSATPGGVLTATCEVAEEKFGFRIEIEPCYDDNVVRTRLAIGDCPDLLVYNTGSLLYSLAPSEFFLDLTDTKMAEKLDSDFIRAASVDGVLYGIPQCDSMSAGVFYNKELYEAYGLELPETWEEFRKNLEVLQHAGVDGMGISLSELVSSQLPFLADNYQVIYENPDFAQEFTHGETGFADSHEGLRTWERYEELVPFLNEDCATASNQEIEDRFFDNRVGHLIQFSSRIPEWMNTYGDEINKIGFFALPGDTKEATGLTIWPSNGIYGNKKSKNQEAILTFMEWYVSEEGQDVMASFYSPAGVFHTGYQPKEKSIELVQEVQKYYTEGNVMLALEYLTPIKGINCAQICNKLGNGRISALEAAEAYDEECRKMALQIGLWE